MKDKTLFFVTIFTTAICFVVSGADLALAIIDLNKGTLAKGFIFVLLALWLFYWGIRNFKNLCSLWRMIRLEKED